MNTIFTKEKVMLIAAGLLLVINTVGFCFLYFKLRRINVVNETQGQVLTILIQHPELKQFLNTEIEKIRTTQ